MNEAQIPTTDTTTTPAGRFGRVRADEVEIGELLTSAQAGIMFPSLVVEATSGIDLNLRRVVEFRLDGHRETIVLRASQTVFVEPSTAH